jgi:glycogen debranching enzyme
MHEFSQTADQVDWPKLPYFYAAADSTPLFVMAMADYARVSGDLAFVREHWDSVKRAYFFTRLHDSDGDGVYDNSEGTGWVESWVPALPHQESYLAALDEQSAAAISELAALMGDGELSVAASRQADIIRDRLIAYRQQDGFYAFSKNINGTYDATRTIFPSVAWWTGRLALPEADRMLQIWNSSEFATDWGLRSISDRSPLYDPSSYHQGSVWPLFTGWVSMAEYNAGHPLAAYQELMSNVNLTRAQDPGAVTEVLSGEFYQPLAQSVSHQMWSSAMILSPLIRGMLGLEVDAIHKNLKVSPKLPAAWDQVVLHHVPFGETPLDVTLRRRRGEILIQAVSKNKQVLCMSSVEVRIQNNCGEAKTMHTAAIQLQPVEIILDNELPKPGFVTQQLKILGELYSPHHLQLDFEAPAGSSHDFGLRFNTSRQPNLSATGATLRGRLFHITFPAGANYQHQTVDIRW